MPVDQALAPDELSAIQILPVPDLWPPTADQTPADNGRRPAGHHGLASIRLADSGARVWPRQFAVLLTEALTGDRPVRQVLPWLSEQGRVQLHRLQPLFSGGQRARIQRVMTTLPSPEVVEMTLIVAVGARTRALAVRLTLAGPEAAPPGWRGQATEGARQPRAVATARWVCTDIEAA